LKQNVKKNVLFYKDSRYYFLKLYYLIFDILIDIRAPAGIKQCTCKNGGGYGI
jgi:hypothetical protein